MDDPPAQYRNLPIIPPMSSDENQDLLKLLLNAPRNNPELIASAHPVRIDKNASFIINLDDLKHAEDLLSDDLGAWEQTKTRSKWYLVRTEENGEVTSVTKVTDRLPGSYQVCRRPYTNKSDRSLKKCIVNVIDPKGSHYNLVYLRYKFEGKEHKIDVKPHGNSTTSKIPYLRTYKSTVAKLKESLIKEDKGIKRVVHEVEEAVGGLEFCKSKGSLPRNENQAKYLKTVCKEKVSDPILEITQKMKLESVEDGEEKFIRCYSLDDDSPKVILFTDDQVDDIVNFCCNDISGHNSLLYVDITFQLGPFFVMMLTYKNTTLYNKRDPTTCPLMIGPMMLCMLKDKSTYLTLFQKLTAHVPGLKMYLQGYSSDSECALRQALAQEFERSVSFVCKLHAKENIKDKCRQLHFPNSLTDTIVNDIFGSGGLVMADSEEDYQAHLDVLTSKWDKLEFDDTRKGPSFSTYFCKHKSEDILNHVSAKASRDAGFGDSVQSNNVPESANALLKRWQGFRPRDMSTFVDDVKQLVDKQKSDVRRAFLGLDSPYMVRPEYIKHAKLPSNFFEDSPGKRTFKDKVLVDPVRHKEVYQYRHAPPVASNQRKEDVNNEEVATNKGCKRMILLDEEVDDHVGVSSNSLINRPQFSLDEKDENCILADFSISSSSSHAAEAHDLKFICSQELEGIFSAKDLAGLTMKADQLIKEDSIRRGFESQSFLVKSSSACVPHYVKFLATGKYNCDNACIGFKTRKICSHVVSVAHTENNLKSFLQIYKKERKKKELNLTAITTGGVNKNAGRKRPVSRPRRKTSPDPLTSMNATQTRQPVRSSQGTIGELFEYQTESCNTTLGNTRGTIGELLQYQAEPSSDPLKITIRRSAPIKPVVTPTTTTPFQLINITGKIKKCAGCRGDLKSGPDEFSRSELDDRFCIRHKEHDVVFIASYQQWKKVFENKHYHVFLNCIEVRNPSFDPKNVHVAVNHTLSGKEVALLKERLAA